jgi:hypothetical protein
LERSFGYVGVRRVSEIGPHIFAHHAPAPDQAARTVAEGVRRAAVS